MSLSHTSNIQVTLKHFIASETRHLQLINDIFGVVLYSYTCDDDDESGLAY